jgi:hypothetical protein
VPVTRNAKRSFTRHWRQLRHRARDGEGPSPRQAPRSCWRTITRTLLSEFLDEFVKGDQGHVLHG